MADQERPTHFLPLYVQVKQLLVQRLIDNIWTPGMALPSEYQLAAELKVSQGTVRKALDEMAMEKLVVRRQGRGTFVSEHTYEQTLFHFFKLVDKDDNRQFPSSRVISRVDDLANSVERQRLSLSGTDQVTRIERVRSFDGTPVIYEVLSVPRELIPDLAEHDELPNSLYSLYQQNYGLSVLKAVERIRAVAADGPETAHLNLAAGTALLEVERTAIALDGRAVELRRSRCLTEHYHYRVELT